MPHGATRVSQAPGRYTLLAVRFPTAFRFWNEFQSCISEMYRRPMKWNIPRAWKKGHRRIRFSERPKLMGSDVGLGLDPTDIGTVHFQPCNKSRPCWGWNLLQLIVGGTRNQNAKRSAIRNMFSEEISDCGKHSNSSMLHFGFSETLDVVQWSEGFKKGAEQWHRAIPTRHSVLLWVPSC